jgi:peptidoglycan/xylan/chitin deacetylase (PgdA/CDA1 family)
VLHDVGPRGERTLATLESVLPELKRRGYQVITLSELAALGEGEG